MGVKSKAIDAMIKAHARGGRREADFVAAIRALDRVLLSGFYVVPLYHLPVQWVARWTKIKHPNRTSLFGYLPETWWHGEAHMILGDDEDGGGHGWRGTAPPSTACSGAPACAMPRRVALADPPDRVPRHRRRAALAHLCRRRPGDLGRRGALARPRPADRRHGGDPAWPTRSKASSLCSACCAPA